ncbi:hypothetical protein WCN79_10525 [Xanthomonas axonopodis pv. vasculorum]|uniref:hypothetical protein n=1 Tax=Xanthomonas axonopodis TaxID=53413 RepID=UPI000A507C7E|nr:hypothetical protein [Xanthomonas axonopodis]PPV09528.1 hypothetical protein XavaCFBP5823_14325 [Xanthomonas axonopodis pv. vasculorum]QKD87099.1 hypothetical protein XAV_12730 [Xanthomonas axonopodis pv. vasculorum]
MRFFGIGRADLRQRLDALEKALAEQQQRTHFLEGQRIRTVRQLAAMQSLVESLIRTHPRPDMLLRWWNHEVPKLIDEVSEVPPDLPAEHQVEALAWQAMVKRYTCLIEAAADFYAQRQEDDD